MARFSILLGACAVAALLLATACDRPPRRSVPQLSAAEQQSNGWHALAQKQYPRAQTLFEAALAREPQLADAWLGLGHALFWQQRFREAQTAYERASELAPADQRALGAIAHCELNLATHSWYPPSQRHNMLIHAQALFQRALGLNPKDEAATYGLGAVTTALEHEGTPPASLQWLVFGSLLVLLGFALRLLFTRGLSTSRAYAVQVLRAVGPMFVATRVLVLLAFWLSPQLLSEHDPHPSPVLSNARGPIMRGVAERWDSNLYVDVAFTGYRADPDAPWLWSSVGQLPLTPILYRFGMYALGDAHWAALVLAHLMTFVACVLLFELVRETHDELVARRAVAVLLLLPGSLFGSVLYAEPIALAFMLGAYVALRRGHWVPAFVCGLLAGMARFNTLALVPLLGYELWQRRKDLPPWAACVVVAPACGIFVYMVYTHFAFGDLFAYFHELRDHRFAGLGVLVALDDARTLFTPERAEPAWLAVLSLGLACLLAYAVAAYFALRRREYGATLCIIAGMLFAVTSSLPAQPRYLWLLFPACGVFAAWPKARSSRALLTLPLSAILFIEALGYAAWYYVT